MTTLTAISVAIPTYNRLDILRETVRRVLAERCQAGDVEVIVIDDQSDDGTWEWLEAESRLHEGLAAIRNPSKGRSSARNAGINAARGAIVCLLDDDMWVTPGFADAHSNLAAAAFQLRQYFRSVEHALRAVDLQPDLIDAHLNLGAAYRELGQMAQARSSFERVLQLNPNDPQAPTIRQWLSETP